MVPEISHPSELIQEELSERGWTLDELAVRMGGDFNGNKLAMELYFAVHDKNLVLGQDMSEKLGTAFDVSPELFMNMDRSWRSRRKGGPSNG